MAIFRRLGYEDLHLNKERVGHKAIYHSHALKQVQVDQALDAHRKGWPLIIPMRHPYLVEESWRRRLKDVSDMILGFRNILKFFLPLEPYWLPVDSDRRDEYLAKLSDAVGLNLEWGDPAGVYYGTNELTLADVEPSKDVRDLVEGSMGPFLDRFYL